MSPERFLRMMGALVAGAACGLVAYFIFNLVGGGSYTGAAAIMVAIVAALSFGWALS